jgi:hypothetical protein
LLGFCGDVSRTAGGGSLNVAGGSGRMALVSSSAAPSRKLTT